MNRYKTKQFIKLKTHWDEKLKASGFKDAENGPFLREWDSLYFQIRHTPDDFDQHQTYFYAATHYLIHGKFDSDLEREIWKLHADGFSYREIVATLKTQHDAHSPHCKTDQCDMFCPLALAKEKKLFNFLNKDFVNDIVNKVKEAMKLYLKRSL